MKTVIFLSLLALIYSPQIYSVEKGKVYPISKTLDFLNLHTKKSVRLVKRGSTKPYYVKIISKNRGAYDVKIVDKNGKPLFHGAKMRIWKKYFNRGVYKQAVDIVVDVTRKIDEIGTLNNLADCADCRDRDEGYDRDTPSKQPLVREQNDDCKYFSKFLQEGVPKEPLQQALTFYKKNRSKFKKRKISIADYSKNSRQKRFFIIDLDSGKVTTHKVSHGSGSQGGVKYGDRDHDGMIDRCQGPSGSRTNMSRPGFFKAAELYWSNGSWSKKRQKYGHRQELNYKRNTHRKIISSNDNLTYGWPTIAKRSSGYKNGLRLDGLSGSINDHARRSGVVMHGAYYNTGSTMGRSYGCPAFTPIDAKFILNNLTGGTLHYSYIPKCSKDMKKIYRQVKGWENTCR